MKRSLAAVAGIAVVCDQYSPSAQDVYGLPFDPYAATTDQADGVVLEPFPFFLAEEAVGESRRNRLLQFGLQGGARQ